MRAEGALAHFQEALEACVGGDAPIDQLYQSNLPWLIRQACNGSCPLEVEGNKSYAAGGSTRIV